ncbi:MAG: hypothetical protein LBU22_05090 [Dysgonamonadaceae bacterium]|jgi:hypothetical protein|nr:hypothetical protein [Dysgonamonadaceae bacterium]
MKRKLFTLLLAFVALGAFQANAQHKVWVNSPAQAVEWSNYATATTTFTSKLTFVPGTGTFIHQEGVKPSYSTYDKITVSNPAANYVDFKYIDGASTTTLTLPYGGVDQTRFVLFTGSGTTVTTVSGATIATGLFSGYLAVQTGDSVKYPDLLLVVHNAAGVLSIRKYSEVEASSGATKLYPLYVSTELMSGRWATADDFKDCSFTSFGTLSAYKAVDLNDVYYNKTNGEVNSTTAINAGLANKKAFSVFTVKQVDYVEAEATGVSNVHNIIVPNASFNSNKGTQEISAVQHVIPLFTLATPENSCEVLSISRVNALETQSQMDGGYANNLEVRKYGEYYKWEYVSSAWKYNSYFADDTNVPTDDDSRYYTSLQKFAIWINEEGEFVLYPAASYYWEYGEKKTFTGATITPDKIVANAVLTYNDINIAPSGPTDPAVDKTQGLQIGSWNGNLTSKPAAPGIIGTMPNIKQSMSDYAPRSYSLVCQDDDDDLSGRFYFLEVYPDTLGNGKSGSQIREAFKAGGYQYNREYVLSTQLTGSKAGKQLVIVPKEKLLSTEKDYWRYPYDSVNMAAHWEVQAAVKVNNKVVAYRFINMLSDTLEYRFDDPLLAGGNLVENGLIAGKPGVAPGSYADEGYFGRPGTTTEAWATSTHWFDRNPLVTAAGMTHDTWKIKKMKDHEFGLNPSAPYAPYDGAFYLELYDDLGATIGLAPNSPWEHGANSIVIGNVGTAGTDSTYYQKSVSYTIEMNGLKRYTYVDDKNNIPACHGLLVALKPIYYVPTGEQYLGKEGDDKIINTGGKIVDGLAIVSSEPTFAKADSLTAYTFLTGNFDITEALTVNNSLKLDTAIVKINNGANGLVTVARLKTTDATDALQFIPLDQTDRKTKIDVIRNNADNRLDVLYGETYKWYLVKYGDKYLRFDTVNYAGRTNREKVGLVFTDATIENALPVRLYQPLVGDKANDNFLFQFYIPHYTYYPTNTGIKFGLNKWPDIESTNPAAVINGGGEVCFASLSNASDYIYATRGYAGTSTGTRFTFVKKEADPGCCPQQFIDPLWMLQERLLSVKLDNQIWYKGIDTKKAIGKKVEPAYNSAIVADAGVQLKHTYVTSIKRWNPSDLNQTVKIPYGAANLTDWSTSVTHGAVSGTKTFENDLEVPLYYVQNAEGEYLTVIKQSEMSELSATVPDVNGVLLAWQKNIIAGSSSDKSRALQLFAISGCMGDADENGFYGEFIYLPLASYKWNYSTNTGESGIYFNTKLGKAAPQSSCAGNDVSEAWRVSQYSYVGSPAQRLVVFNSLGATGGNLVPLEFKVKTPGYQKPDCDYVLVQNNNQRTADADGKDKYYTFNGSISDVYKEDGARKGVFNLNAHWKVNESTNDDFLFTFEAELKNAYTQAISQAKLLGKYYFVDKNPLPKAPDAYLAINVDGYLDGTTPFKTVYDTLTLTCVNHNLPFFNLESISKNVSALKVAIIETPFKDRSLTDKVDGINTPIYRTSGENWKGYKPYAYRTYIKNVLDLVDYKDATYLQVYQENKRYLSDVHADVPVDSVHIIPYYSFSYVDEVDHQEYFLNVDIAKSGVDSVYWTRLTETARDSLLEYWKYPEYLPKYKFCLPYKEGIDDETSFKGTTVPSVYLQTLDLAINDYPYLVVAGSSTKYVTARRLDDALIGTSIVDKSLEYNIYSVDYSKIDPIKVTTWLLGGEASLGNEWLPIKDALTSADHTATGVLTDYALDGVTFIAQSGQSPVNYGIFTGKSNAVALTFEFEGDTTIGQILPKPIWYFRIKLDGQYLTDSYPATGDYVYNYSGINFALAYFNKTKIAAIATDKITADPNFVQTFGFWYVKDKSLIGGEDAQAENVQAFYVVSNANYKTNNGDYRFLSEVNNHLVFVKDLKDALIFQYSKIAGGTGIQVIGKSGIFAVDGGVRVLEGSGKVDLYTIDGRLIKSAVISGADQILAAPKGVVIVKNGSKVVKVVVK